MQYWILTEPHTFDNGACKATRGIAALVPTIVPDHLANESACLPDDQIPNVGGGNAKTVMEMFNLTIDWAVKVYQYWRALHGLNLRELSRE
ncbi:MAG TPA: hypothetical protein VF062_05605 [Candidatus Limnocylindrales bacterium]